MAYETIKEQQLTLTIHSREDGVLQLRQVLDEEVKAGYIKRYEIKLMKWSDKKEYCAHQRFHLDGSPKWEEFCPDCTAVLAARG